MFDPDFFRLINGAVLEGGISGPRREIVDVDYIDLDAQPQPSGQIEDEVPQGQPADGDPTFPI